MRKRLVVAVTLLTPALGLAACGDSSDDGDSVEAEGDVSIEMRDFEFSPSDPQATAGETITVELENTGSARHTFTTDGIDEEVSPGDSTTVDVEVPDGGLTFVCRFHEGQGMTGEFVVAGGGGGGQPPPTTAGGGSETAPTTSDGTAPTTSGGGGAPGY